MKYVLTDENGNRYNVDFKKGIELGVIKKEILDLWKPKSKEKYFYCNESLSVSEIENNSRYVNKKRFEKGNCFKEAAQAEKYAIYSQSDINYIILKFAIENNCLVLGKEEFKNTKDKYMITFSLTSNDYVVEKVITTIIPHTVILNDKEKAVEIMKFLNNKKMGYINEDNFNFNDICEISEKEKTVE